MSAPVPGPDPRIVSTTGMPSDRETVPGPAGERPGGEAGAGAAPAAYDPLKLCIFATVALLGWLAGPVAVVVFAGVGFAGYWKARRAGLTRSKCYLRDTRLVLTYLAALVAAGVVGAWLWVT